MIFQGSILPIMIPPTRPTTKYIDAIEELQQQVNELQAKLSAEAESYRLIISTMATTCRTLQARVRTLEGERLESVAEEGHPSTCMPSPLSFAGSRARRRHTARAMSWPTIIPEASIIRKDILDQPAHMPLTGTESPEPLPPSSCLHPSLSYPRQASVDDIVFQKAYQSWF